MEPLQHGASGSRHFRGKTVQRAIKSVISQQFKDWELILVNDGCVDGVTPSVLEAFARDDPRIKVFHRENGNRAIARNHGMDRAKGEWICWLDSDDEYSTNYLRELDKAIKDFPQYKIFNFGSIIHWPDHNTSIREVFRPEETKNGHVWFRSGHIGCGSFVFKRELWVSSKKYRIPDESNPFEFASKSRFDMRFSEDEPDVEDPTQAFTDGVKRQGLSLGNPWGDDFLQFYLLTRDNKSKALDVLIYVQYPRGHEEAAYDVFGEIYDTN
jgi:glycosyltransferase involved in cell wall biosynthesis